MREVKILINDGDEKYSRLIEFLRQYEHDFSIMPVLPQAYVSRRFLAPFRVGRKQKRAVLDSNGLEVVIFPKGLESWAELYCSYLNKEMAA
jgi:hypothetical protein